MGLIFWWLLPIWLVGIGGVVYTSRRSKRKLHSKLVQVPIAHTDRLTTLPVYTRALRRYISIIRLACVVIVIAVIASLILSLRPTAISVVTPAQKSRDIMLCLDVSGSMSKVDIQAIDQFGQLVRQFSGQRFGLTIFNSSAITVIPLTDDYELIGSQLTLAKKGLQAATSGASYDFVTGTMAGADAGASLIGDGLASCVSHLGTNTTHRMQSVILATDNEAMGTSIISMPQATALAKKKGIRIYAIDPGQSADSALVGANDSDHAQLRTLALETGGGYYLLSDHNAVSSVISQISKHEATYYVGTSQIAKTDTPEWFEYVFTVCLITFLLLAWRFKL